MFGTNLFSTKNNIKFKSIKSTICLLVIIFFSISLTNTSSAQVSRSGALLRSAVFPGWGSYKMSGGNGNYLVPGFIFYGSLATSYFLHKKSVEQYDKYLPEKNISERNKYADGWKTNRKTAKSIAVLSAGIWTADILLVLLRRNKSKLVRINKVEYPYKIVLGSSFNSPTLNFSLKF